MINCSTGPQTPVGCLDGGERFDPTAVSRRLPARRRGLLERFDRQRGASSAETPAPPEDARSLAARASSSATANRCCGLPGHSSRRAKAARAAASNCPACRMRPAVVVIMLAEELPVAGDLRRLQPSPVAGVPRRARSSRPRRPCDAPFPARFPGCCKCFQAALHLDVLRVLLRERLLQGRCAAERMLRRRGLSEPALRQAEVVAADGQRVRVRFPRRRRVHQFALDFHRLGVGLGRLGRAPMRDCTPPKLLYVSARSLR